MPPTLAARGGPQWPRTNSLSTPRSSGAASGYGHGKSKSNGVAGKTVFGTRGRAVRQYERTTCYPPQQEKPKLT
ncbi:hypothetical protein NOR_02111 [Metarhizium rileyi]|uniref:Uncharacterized protein n=1 Tax=Metarhizium rileyi (strain RCEF 4871) TaxID=1649241 RepID=A0A167H8Q4_METRR|nr:hypothetical protein NOR_02111 [Metarhizium rileyi RCEF 4871]